MYIMETVILNDTVQNLEQIIGIALIIKIVEIRVAIWQRSISVIKVEK